MITATGLLFKASQVDGVILYNKFSVIFFAELFKLVIACGTGMYETTKKSCHSPDSISQKEDADGNNDYANMEDSDLKRYRDQKALFDYSNGEEEESPNNKEKTQQNKLRQQPFPTWKHIVQYSIPGALYVIVHNVRFSIYEYINPGVVSVCWNVKIVFVALLLKFVLGRTISLRQWIGISLLIMGGVVTELSQLLWHNDTADLSFTIEEEAVDEWEEISQSNEGFEGELKGLLFLVFGMAMVAIANVTCEYLYKQKDQIDNPFYKQNIVLYSWGVAFNGTLWLAQEIHSTSTGIFDNYSYYTVALIVAEGLSGYLHGAIFKYLDAITAIFAGVIAMLATAILSAIFFDLHINYLFCLGFGLSVVSIYIYFVEKSRIVCLQDEALLSSLSEEEEDNVDDNSNNNIQVEYDGASHQEGQETILS